MAAAAASATPAAAASAAQVYTVFSVDSADRLNLLAPPSAISPAPKIVPVILSFVNAPKIGRRTATGEIAPDEPCAFDAFELVRSNFIGKSVRFVEDYTIEALSRVAGRVILADNTNAALLLLQKGLATTPERPPPKMSRELFEQYTSAQSAAKAAKIGLFAPDAAKRLRVVKQFPPANAADLASAMKGQTIKVRVDRVISASGLIVTPLDDSQQSLQLNLTGIQAPPANKRDGSGPDQVGTDAKFHTERLLNQRHISVLFEGIDSFGNFLGSIVSPKGQTFQEDLLSKGFAKTHPATIIFTTARDAFVAAERDAQSRKVGVWHDFQEKAVVAAAAGGAGAKVTAATPLAVPADFEGVLVNVVSGDLVVVRNPETNEFIKLSLVGVRAPKTVVRDQELDRATGQRAPEVRISYEDWTWESRELIRAGYIGHTVLVHVEYMRVVEETKETRGVANIVDKASGENLSILMLQKGMGRFFLGKTDTCSNGAALAAAEAQAKERKVGVHSATPPPATKLTEINRCGEKKARHYLGFLQRGMVGNRPPTWKAIVELVLSGSSFRVYVPREHFVFTLRLAGVVSPSTAQAGQPADPFANESKDFAVALIQQREVDIQVETVDRGGNFIGYVRFNGKNVAQSLVEAGLATVAQADRVQDGSLLLAAQKTAQEAKRNIWSEGGAVPARQARRDEKMKRAGPQTFQRVTGAAAEWAPYYVMDIADPNTLFVMAGSEDNERLSTELAEAAQHVVANDPRPHQPTKGEIVVAQYDHAWYRAKCTAVVTADNRFEVTFMDYGSTRTLKSKDIRVIPSGVPEVANLKSEKALAEAVHLAYLKPHANVESDAADAALEALWSIIDYDVTEGACYLSFEYTNDDGRKKFVSLNMSLSEARFDDVDLCVNLYLLKRGAFLADRSALTVAPEKTAAILAAQERARRDHVGLWRYGDVGEDDDEDA